VVSVECAAAGGVIRWQGAGLGADELGMHGGGVVDVVDGGGLSAPLAVAVEGWEGDGGVEDGLEVEGGGEEVDEGRLAFRVVEVAPDNEWLGGVTA
jgi:hypothetical protein